MFATRKRKPRQKIDYDECDLEDDVINDYELGLLKTIDENDKEIDKMLDQVIIEVGKLKYSAQDLQSGIRTQEDLLKKVNNKAEKARIRLQKRSSELQGILEKYRNTNKLCMDMVLVVILLILIGVVIKVLKVKGYM